METWKTVRGYEGRYEVSNRGQVASLQFKGRPRPQPLILKLSIDPAGRPYVTLYPGKVTAKVCHLVAAEFLPPKKPGQEVCHNDGDPANNWDTNLRWDTHLSNGKDMVRHGRTNRCDHDPACRVTDKHGHSRCTRCTQDSNRRSYVRLKAAGYYQS